MPRDNSAITGGLNRWISRRQDDPRDRSVYGRGRTPGAPAEIVEYDGAKFYANSTASLKDPSAGGGYISGSASTLLDKPTWVFHHSIRRGQNTASTLFNTTASTFGNFTDAWADLDGIADAVSSGQDWNICYRWVETENPKQTRARLMQQAPLAIWFSQFTGTYMAQCYKTAPDTWDYFADPNGTAYEWKPSDIIPETLRVYNTPLSECVNEVRINYRLYAPTNSLTRTTFVSPTGSDDGTGTQDQNTTAPDDRETRASDQQSNLGFSTVGGTGNNLEIDCDQIYVDAVAVAFRNYLFDRFLYPRLIVEFDSWRGAGLEPHMATLISDDMADILVPPYYPIGSSAKAWSDLIFNTHAPRIRGTAQGIIYSHRFEMIP